MPGEYCHRQQAAFTIRVMIRRAWIVLSSSGLLLVWALSAVLTLGGCKPTEEQPPARPELVVYTSVDQPYAQEVLDRFSRQTGIALRVVYDSEASKSVGLAERVIAERDSPKCDVWWGSEVFYTVRLAEAGVLASFSPESAKDVRARYRDPQHRWTGVGLRVRVIALAEGDASVPVELSGIEGLADPRLKGRIAMARPTAGTTGGHVAALYAYWGDELADAYFRRLRENGIKLLGGNAIVAQQVASGLLAAGLTDNDDCDAASAAMPGKLRTLVPDQGPDGMGTLTIPTTVALVAGRPGDRSAAHRLVEYLVSEQVERTLIERRFARYSVRASDRDVRAMPADYAEVARKLPEAVRRATAILEGR